MRISKPVKVLVVCTFILVIAVNALAEIIPLNGLNTGQVSDAYPNLLTPAPYTFLIWSLIYVLLLLHVLHVLGVFRSTISNTRLLTKVEVLFSLSSIANAAWMVAWHFKLIWLSLVLMIVILVLLGVVFQSLRSLELPLGQRILVRAPFSFYFGWITIATIANVTVLLVSLGFTGAPSPHFWTVAVLIVGLIIGVLTILRTSDICYALVFIWAYIGILVRHLSPTWFDGRYGDIVVTLCASLAILIVVSGLAIVRRSRGEAS